MAETNDIENLIVDLRRRFNRLQEEANNAQMGIIAERSNALSSRDIDIIQSGHFTKEQLNTIRNYRSEMASLTQEILANSPNTSSQLQNVSKEQLQNAISKLQSTTFDLLNSGMGNAVAIYTPEEAAGVASTLKNLENLSNYYNASGRNASADQENIASIGKPSKGEASKATGNISVPNIGGKRSLDDFDAEQEYSDNEEQSKANVSYQDDPLHELEEQQPLKKLKDNSGYSSTVPYSTKKLPKTPYSDALPEKSYSAEDSKSKLEKTISDSTDSDDYSSAPKKEGLDDEEYAEILAEEILLNVEKINKKNIEVLESLEDDLVDEKVEIEEIIELLQEHYNNQNKALVDLQKIQNDIPEKYKDIKNVAKVMNNLEKDIGSFHIVTENLQKIQTGQQLNKTLKEKAPQLEKIADTLESCVDRSVLKKDHVKQLVITSQINKVFADKYMQDGVPLKKLFDQKPNLDISKLHKEGSSEEFGKQCDIFRELVVKTAEKTAEDIDTTKALYQEEYSYVEKTQLNNNRIIKFYEHQAELDKTIHKAINDVAQIADKKKKLEEKQKEEQAFKDEIKVLVKDSSESNQDKIIAATAKVNALKKEIDNLIKSINKISADLGAATENYKVGSKLYNDIEGLTADLINERLSEEELQTKLIANLDEEEKDLFEKIKKAKTIDVSSAKTLDELEKEFKGKNDLFAKKIEQARNNIEKFSIDQLLKVSGVANFESNSQLKDLGLGEAEVDILNISIKSDIMVEPSETKAKISKFDIEIDQDVFASLVEIINKKDIKVPDGAVPPPPAGGPPPPPPLPGGAKKAKEKIDMSMVDKADIRLIDLILAQNKAAKNSGHTEGAKLKKQHKDNIVKSLDAIFTEQIKKTASADQLNIASLLNAKAKFIKSEEQYTELKQDEAKEANNLIEKTDIDKLKTDLESIKSGDPADKKDDFLKLLEAHELETLLNKKVEGLTADALDNALSLVTIINDKKSTDLILKHIKEEELPEGILSEAAGNTKVNGTPLKLVSTAGLAELIYGNDLPIETAGSDKKVSLFSEARKDLFSSILDSEGKPKTKTKFKKSDFLKKGSSSEAKVKNLLEEEFKKDIAKLKVKELFAKVKFKEADKARKTEIANNKAKLVEDNVEKLFNGITSIPDADNKKEIFAAIKDILKDFCGDIFDIAKIADIELKQSASKILKLNNKNCPAHLIPSHLKEMGIEEFKDNLAKAYDANYFFKRIDFASFHGSDAQRTFKEEAWKDLSAKYKDLSIDALIKDLDVSNEEIAKLLKTAKANEFIAKITTAENASILDKLIKNAGGKVEFFEQLANKGESLTEELSKLEDGELVEIFREQLAKKWDLSEDMQEDLLKINKDGARKKLTQIQRLDAEKEGLVHKELVESSDMPLKATETEIDKFKDNPKIKEIEKTGADLDALLKKISESVKECKALNITEEIDKFLDIIENNKASLKSKSVELTDIAAKFSKNYINYKYKLKGESDPYIKVSEELASFKSGQENLESYLKIMRATYKDADAEDQELYSAVITKLELTLTNITSDEDYNQAVDDAISYRAKFKSINSALDSGSESKLDKTIKEFLKLTTEDDVNAKLAEIYAEGFSDTSKDKEFLVEILLRSYLESQSTIKSELRELFDSKDFKEYKGGVTKAESSIISFANESDCEEVKNQKDYITQITNKIKADDLGSADLEEIINTAFSNTILVNSSNKYNKGLKVIIEKMPKLAMQQYDITGDRKYIDEYLDQFAGILSQLTAGHFNSFNRVADKIESSLARFVNDSFGKKMLEDYITDKFSADEAAKLLEHKAFTSLAPSFTPIPASGSGSKVPPPPPPPPPPGGKKGPPPPPPGAAPSFVGKKAAASKGTTTSIDYRKENQKRLDEFNDFLDKLKNFIADKIDDRSKEGALSLKYAALTEKVKADYGDSDIIKNELSKIDAELKTSMVEAYDNMLLIDKKPFLPEFFASANKGLRVEIIAKLRKLLAAKLTTIKTKQISSITDKEKIEECNKNAKELAKQIKEFTESLDPSSTYKDIQIGYREVYSNLDEFENNVELMKDADDSDKGKGKESDSAAKSFFDKKVETLAADDKKAIKEKFVILEGKLGPAAIENKKFVTKIIDNFDNKNIQDQILLIEKLEDISKTIFYRLLCAEGLTQSMAEMDLNNILKASDDVDDTDVKSDDGSTTDLDGWRDIANMFIADSSGVSTTKEYEKILIEVKDLAGDIPVAS